MLSAASVNQFGKALIKALSPECGLRNVLAIQKRNQCRYDDDNANAKKQYDEQESQFTDQELNLFKKLFLKYDRDDNCKLDRWEFNQFAKFLVGRSYNSIDLEKGSRHWTPTTTGSSTGLRS
uniref:Mitochondrial Rho GTPase n=1 Tax=Lygus hesperus TaxID=30085 RepID=A0A0A9VX85_LYGHE